MSNTKSRAGRPVPLRNPAHWQLSCTDDGLLIEGNLADTSGELVRLSIRNTVSAELARVIVNHMVTRYAGLNPELPF